MHKVIFQNFHPYISASIWLIFQICAWGISQHWHSYVISKPILPQTSRYFQRSSQVPTWFVPACLLSGRAAVKSWPCERWAPKKKGMEKVPDNPRTGGSGNPAKIVSRRSTNDNPLTSGATWSPTCLKVQHQNSAKHTMASPICTITDERNAADVHPLGKHSHLENERL